MSTTDDISPVGSDADHSSEPADPHPERLDGSGRRQTRIAPPDIGADRLPTPLLECGCGDCYDALVDPLAEDGPRAYAAEDCPSPQPMTVERAAEVYVRYQRSAWNADSRTSTYERAVGQYGRLLEADRRMQRRYGDRLTTAMVTRRLSPLDDDGGDWIEPVTLDARLHDSGAKRAFTRALRYHLGDVEFEYIGVTAATESAATPHEHVYLWIDDPDDVVTVDHLAPALEKHVTKVPGAYDRDHEYRPDGSAGAITVRHDPPRVDHCPEEVSAILGKSDAVREGEQSTVGSRSVPAPTAGAQYLASQLPHLVLGDVYDGGRDVSDVRLDGGAVAWASTHDWLRSSSGIDF